MGRRNSSKMNSVLLAIVAVVVIAGVVWFMNDDDGTAASIRGGSGGVGGGTYACPDDGQTAMVLDVANPLNTTAAETNDVEYTLLSDGGHRTTGTDTTSPTAFNLNCGDTYTLYLSSDTDNNSKILSIIEGNDAKLNVDGSVTFVPSKDQYNLRVGAAHHDVLGFKAYDEANAAWMCNSDQACGLNWIGDGADFESTTNETAIALSAAGDYVDMTLKVRANNSAQEFCNEYCLIAIEAPTTEYATPVLKWNGQKLTDIKGSGLNVHEQKGLSGYEYVYKLTAPLEHDSNDLSFYIEATGNAATDLQIDFLAAGKIDSINGVDIITSAYTDASSPAVVFAIEDVTIDIS